MSRSSKFMNDDKYKNLSDEFFPLCKNPVFIIGAARSGTTWVQTLISAHPDFISCAETHFFDILLYSGLVCGGYQLHRPKHIWHEPRISLQFLEYSFQQIEKGFIRLSNKTKQKLMKHASENRLSTAGYLNAIMYDCNNLEETSKKRWVDKTPIHISYIKDIFQCFPDAKIICVIRNPIDVMLSAYTSLQVPLGVALLDYIRSYQAVHTFLSKYPAYKKKVYFIYYEDIKKQQQKIVEDMFGFINIKLFNVKQIFNDSKKEFHKLYGGTVLEAKQPEMKNKSSDVPDSYKGISKKKLLEISRYFLPNNPLWKRYLHRDINIEPALFKRQFPFILKEGIHAVFYVVSRKGLWILRMLHFKLK